MAINSTFSRSLRAEWLKLKGTPIRWLTLLGGVFPAAFIFLIHFFNVEQFTETVQDPWILYLDLSFMLATMLFLIPFVVLLAGAIVYPEHDGQSWKYLYALPIRKGVFYFSKLLMVLFLLIGTFAVFFACSLLGAYLLDLFFPQYGFREYSVPAGHFVLRLIHALLAVLGITAIHYWFSVRWKSFILPIGIGLLGFIVATFVVFVGGRYDLAAYLPYAYPMMVGAELGTQPVGLPRLLGIISVEWYSVALLVVAGGLGFYEESRKNVL